ncbi:hypothetical protein FCV25MIE_22095 [Fagus crenata]
MFLVQTGSNINGGSGDDSLSIPREGADTTTLLDDADYIVPPGQCCIIVEFGLVKPPLRWCHLHNCFDFKNDCFQFCQHNHQPVAHPILEMDSNTGSSGDDSLGISREGADTTALLDDVDYMVPPLQCCEKVNFGRDIYRWCPLNECYNSKEDCFHSCQKNHQTTAPLVSKKP